jgi:SAM-dependent methyltransferase
MDPSGGNWFSSPAAQRLLRDEQRELIPLLTGTYGRAGLYIRCAASAPAELSGNMMQSLLRLHREPGRLAGDLICLDAELPLQRESVDLVYLLHAIETTAKPAQLFAEIERVLTPEGSLLLVAMNPLSPWRLRWLTGRIRVLGVLRCRELLADAGLEIVQQRGLGPVLPWFASGRRQDAARPAHDIFAALRAGYAIVARKRRHGITPIRNRAGAVALKPEMYPG